MDDLTRFIDAQEPVMAAVRRELADGRKRSHWMWFVFPQLRGLGRSEAARHFGLASREEAAEYLRHPVLGPRLRACVDQVLAIERRSAREIFDTPDDLKLHSCLTLFDAIEAAQPAPARSSAFGRALARFFDGRPDALTLQRLASGA